jgi:hypothetical protein
MAQPFGRFEGPKQVFEAVMSGNPSCTAAAEQELKSATSSCEWSAHDDCELTTTGSGDDAMRVLIKNVLEGWVVVVYRPISGHAANLLQATFSNQVKYLQFASARQYS